MGRNMHKTQDQDRLVGMIRFLRNQVMRSLESFMKKQNKKKKPYGKEYWALFKAYPSSQNIQFLGRVGEKLIDIEWQYSKFLASACARCRPERWWPKFSLISCLSQIIICKFFLKNALRRWNVDGISQMGSPKIYCIVIHFLKKLFIFTKLNI